MALPATTVKVTRIEPLDANKVRICMELIADVNRLSDVASQLLSASIAHAKEEAGTAKRR